MAKNVKKTKNKLDSSVDHNPDLDFEDFNFDTEPPKDDRKPITRLGVGAYEGLRDSLVSKENLIRQTKNILPSEYGETFDKGADVLAKAKNLYEDGVKEIKPAIKDVKRLASKLIPADSKYIPQSMKDTLQQWKTEFESKATASQSTEQNRENLISATIADAFKEQFQAQIQEKKETDKKDTMKMGLDISRHRDIYGALNESNKHLGVIANYETKITLAYQKKSLELQFRHLFVSQDILNETKELLRLQRESLPVISKNTGLPDFVKMQSSEIKSQIYKNKFYESINSGLFGGVNEYVEKTVKNIKSKVIGKIKESVGDFRRGLSEVQNATDMSDGFGVDKAKLAGTAMGAFGAELATPYLTRLGTKIREKYVDKNEKIQKGAKYLKYGLGNADRLADEFRRSDKYENRFDEDTGIFKRMFNNVMRGVQSVLPGNYVDDSVKTDSADEMYDPFTFTKRTDKSINEVIPGYLARILREIQITRTGDEKTQLTLYDYDTNKFSSKSDIITSLKKQIFRENDVEFNQKSLDEIFKRIDPEGYSIPGSVRNKISTTLTKKGTKITLDQVRDLIDAFATEDKSSMNFIERKKESFSGVKLDTKAKTELVNRFKQEFSKNDTLDTKLDSLLDAIGANSLSSQERASLKQAIVDNSTSGKLGSINNILTYIPEQHKQKIGKILKDFIGEEESPEYIDKFTKFTELHNEVSNGIKDPRYKIQQLLSLGRADELEEMGLYDPIGKKILIDKYIKNLYSSKDSIEAKNAIGDNAKEPTQYDLFKDNINTDEIFGIIQEKEDTSKTYTKEEFFRKAFDEINSRLDKIIEKSTLSVIGLNEMSSSIKNGFFSTLAMTNTEFAKAYEKVENSSVYKRSKKKIKQTKDKVQELNFGKNIPGFIARGAHFVSSNLVSSSVNAVKAVLNLQKKINSTARKAYINTKSRLDIDVYVGDEPEPRLLAAKIIEGEYIDLNTKRVLYTFRDITGPIVDRQGNLLITAEEVGNLKIVFNSKRIRLKIKSAIGAAFDASKNAVGKFINFTRYFGIPKALTVTKFIKNFTVNSLGITKDVFFNLIDEPQDIYVGTSKEPTLIGIVMRNGGYFSKATGKVIKRPSDIDGTVVDKFGQVVLSMDQISKGLFDVNSKPLTSIFNKVKNTIFKTASLVGSLLKKTWSMSKKTSAAAWGALKGIGSSIFNGFSIEVNTKRNVTVLEQIRDFLYSRFGNKKISGDTDGDGDREGSYQDIQEKKEKEKNKGFGLNTLRERFTQTKDRLIEKTQESFLGKTFGKLFSKSEKTGEDSLEELKEIKNILQVQTASSLMESKLPGKAKGKLGKLLKFGKGALGVGMKALPFIGAGVGLSSAYASMKDGDYGEAAVEGALGVGSLAFGSSTVAAALGAVGTAALGILSSPVVIGVGAAALAGAAVYYGYKYYKNNTLTPIDNLRYVQYGFNQNDKNFVSSMFALESEITPALYNDSGTIKVNGEKLNIPKLLSIFGLDPKNKDDLNKFFQWYKNRFEPVLLTHATALFNINANKNVSAANELSGDKLKQYLQAVRFAEGPYSYIDLPFRSTKPINPSGPRDVANAYALAMAKLDIREQSNKPVTLTEAVAKQNQNSPSVQNINKDIELLYSVIQEDARDEANMPNTVSSSVSRNMLQGKDKASALLAVKYRCYGLKDLDVSKVRSLRVLESVVEKHIHYSSDYKAIYSADDTAILEKVAGMFGIADVNSKQAIDWVTWFRKRFLPVYLGYASGYAMLTGKASADSQYSTLKPIDQLNLAKIISAIAGIWSVNQSAWPDYVMNMDSKTIEQNIEFLDSIAKETKLQEDKKSTSPDSGKAVGIPEKQGIKTDLYRVSKDSTASTNAEPEQKPRVNASSNNGTPGTIPKIAPGELFSGSNGFSAINLQQGVTLNNVNPAFLKLFYGAVEEYNQLTGKKVTVTDAFRTYQQQVQMKNKHGSKAAQPGSSLHEYGLAIDADSKALNEMESMGLLKKYGITRPIGGEPWHIEPAGIQLEANKFKNRPTDAEKYIAAAVGGGGGGMGSVANAPEGSFNRKYQQDLLMAAVKPTPKNQEERTLTQKRNLGFKDPDQSSKVAQSDPLIDRVSGRGDIEPRPRSTSVMKPTGIDPKPPTSNDQTTSVGDLRKLVHSSAQMVGVDPAIAMATVAVESGFNANAKAGTSSASGLYQFTNAAWQEATSRYSSKYGLDPAVSRSDPKANAILGAANLKANMDSLSKSTGLSIGPVEAYLAHFLGLTGARTFLNALHSNDKILAKDILPQAAQANSSMFYNGSSPRTVRQLYDLISDKLYTTAGKLGIKLPNGPNISDRLSTIAKAPITGASITDTSSDMAKVSVEQPKAIMPVVTANRNILNDNIGINPEMAFRRENSVQNKLTDTMLKPTEDLLAQSLDVEKKMLDIMTKILNVVSTKNSDKGQIAPSQTPVPVNKLVQPDKPYTPQRAPVSMAKSII